MKTFQVFWAVLSSACIASHVLAAEAEPPREMPSVKTTLSQLVGPENMFEADYQTVKDNNVHFPARAEEEIKNSNYTHVVTFNEKGKTYLMMPLKDYFLDPKRVGVFREAAQFGRLLLKDYLGKVKAAGNAILEQIDVDELKGKSIEELEGMWQEETDPRRKNRIQLWIDAQSIDGLIGTLKTDAAIDGALKEQIAKFSSTNPEQKDFQGFMFPNDLSPNTLVIWAGGKMPHKWFQKLVQMRNAFGAAASLLKSGIISVSLRPWKAFEIDYGNRKVREFIYWETSYNVWVNSDTVSGKTPEDGKKTVAWKNNFRAGVGALWNDYSTLSSFWGAYIGRNWNHAPFSSTFRDGIDLGGRKVPIQFNMKYGVLPQPALSWNPIDYVQSAYLLVGYQTGEITSITNWVGTGNAGGIIPFMTAYNAVMQGWGKLAPDFDEEEVKQTLIKTIEKDGNTCEGEGCPDKGEGETDPNPCEGQEESPDCQS